MRLSIQTTLPRLREDAAAFAKAGAAGVTLAARPSALTDLGATARRDIYQAVAARGLAAAILRIALPGKGLAAGFDGDRVLDGLRRALTFARDCGFSAVACDLGALPRVVQAGQPKAVASNLGPLILPTAADIARVSGEPDADNRPLSPAERDHADAVAEVMAAVGAAADPVGGRRCLWRFARVDGRAVGGARACRCTPVLPRA